MNPRAKMRLPASPLPPLLKSASIVSRDIFSSHAPRASQSKYAAPASLTAENAAGLAAMAIATPLTHRHVCTMTPEHKPHASVMPVRVPFARLSVITKSMSGPGINTRAAQATIYATIIEMSISSREYVGSYGADSSGGFA